MKLYQRFFQQLLMLYRPFESRLNIELSKHDLYRAQWTILYYLYHHGSATLVELAEYQHVEKPTVTRTMARLEELKFVKHVPGQDRREKRMSLTELGMTVYKEVRKTIDAYEEEILVGISEEEQLEVIRMMEQIRKNITK